MKEKHRECFPGVSLGLLGVPLGMWGVALVAAAQVMNKPIVMKKFLVIMIMGLRFFRLQCIQEIRELETLPLDWVRFFIAK